MYRYLFQLIAALVLVAVVSLVVKGVHPDATELSVGITQADLIEGEILAADVIKLEAGPAGVMWVDLRPHAEFEDSHIDGAINVSVLEGDDLLQALFDQEMKGVELHATPVILYCASKECDESHRVRKELQEMNTGITIHVLAGGWPEYKRVMRTREK